jgi:hypothetical protein
MHVPRMLVVAVIVAASAFWPSGSRAQASLQIPPSQLVSEVVYNELHDHERHGYWRYFTEKHTEKGTRVEDQVETADGTVSWLVLSNGRPPAWKAREAEAERLNHLINSDGDRARLRQEHLDDEKRIGRILALLPDAFLFDYVNAENGCWRLRFRPNPRYPAQTVDSRIFHAMSGELWIDERSKHMVRLEGQLQSNIDFGFGILGRLYKGGWFRLERVQVSATDWKTRRLEIHMSGRAMLFKTIARETSEARGDFSPVPAAMNLKDGVEMLRQQNSEPPQRDLAVSTHFVAHP